MDLSRYIDILRRRGWFMVAAVLVVALAAGIGSALRTPTYRASVQLWLQPDSSVAQSNSGQAAAIDPSRFEVAQIAILRSEAVANQAATSLHGFTPREVKHHISVVGAAGSDVVTVSATDAVPTRARDLANAVASGYIENRRQNAVASLQVAAKDIDGQIHAIQTTISNLDAQLIALPANALSRDAVKADRDAAATQYQTLVSRQQELADNIARQSGGAEIIAPATKPRRPSSPNPARDAILGGLVGLALSGGVVALREQLDDRLRSPEDAGRALGLPILAELPYDEDLAAGTTRLALLERPQGALSEAVRSLRTTINWAAIDDLAKFVVVTSPVAGEGKSVVSANLAAACAQAGQRTVLVEADLRRPGVSKLFELPDDTLGLTDYLRLRHEVTVLGWDLDRTSEEGGCPVEMQNGVVDPFVHPMHNLLFLPSGTLPSHPAELLTSRRMRALLEQIGEQCDIVVIDSPPLLAVTDAAILASLADVTVLVLAMNHSRLKVAQKAKAILDASKAHMMGLVVNKMPRSASEYYAQYYRETSSPNGSSGDGEAHISGPRDNAGRRAPSSPGSEGRATR